MMNVKQIFKYLEKHKLPLGFGDWDMKIEGRGKQIFVHDLGSNHAEVTPDPWRKELRFKFSKSLKKEEDSYVRNVLIHELIHARVALSREKAIRLTTTIWDEEEEMLVNDITTAIQYLEETK